MINQDFSNLAKKGPYQSKDYRLELKQFKVNRRGDLLINRDGTDLNNWEVLIPKYRLTESDWISHMKEKAYCNFGEFVCSYLKALEIAGVKTMTIDIYGFDYACKYADGR